MTYQFDPRPEGLHYEPFNVDFAKKTMWYLHDPAPEPWVDLRSIFEAMGTSWRSRWAGYCEARKDKWGLEACMDKRMRETMLAPANRIPAILGEAHTHLINAGFRIAAERIHKLRSRWRGIYEVICGRKPPVNAGAQKKAPKTRTLAKRKVNAFVVRQCFQALQNGHKQKDIAKALQISAATVRALAAGTYPTLDEEGSNAWWETFGGALPPESRISAAKRASDMSGDSVSSPPPFGRASGPQIAPGQMEAQP